MSVYPPITLRAVDASGNELFTYSVPFSFEISVKEVMEHAFVLNQKPPPLADPFVYTVEYYGYSESPQFPGYLGYEIESIGVTQTSLLPTNNQFYWELLINDAPATSGADTTFPGPGSTVLWQYKAITANAQNVTARAKVVQSRRAARTGKS